MKKAIRVLALSLIMTILVTNICYATTLTSQQLNTSLEKMFSNDIKIDQDSSTESITMQGQDVEIRGKQIKLIEKETKEQLIINYTIEDNVCRFESSIELGINQNATQEELMEAFSLIMYQAASYDICYLAVADTLGVDLSLAYTYYSQNYNNESIDVQNKVFSIETNLPESGSNATSLNVSTMVLEVNCLELAQLDSSDVDQSDTYTVTVMTNEENIIPPTEDDGENETVVQTPSTNQNVQGTQSTQTSKGEEKNTTTVNIAIPKAGLNGILIFVILVLVIFAVIMYRKNKKYSSIF